MPKVYKEVYEIVKYLPEEEFNKIPKEIIKYMHDNMDRDYDYQINFDDFENQEMQYETQLILAIFYSDYWATPEQKEKIIAKEKWDEQVYQEKMRERYNPDDIFKNKKETSKTDTQEQQEENIVNSQEEKSMVKYKENIFQRIIAFIKNIFSKR